MNTYNESNKIGLARVEKQMAVAREVDYNPTVRENLDKRIAHLEHELSEARASREALAPLLDIKIRDIRRAMDY